MNRDRERIVVFIQDGQPPYLGKPLISILTALGDEVGSIVSSAISSGQLAIGNVRVAERALAVIAVAFAAPERILLDQWRQPNTTLASIKEISARNLDPGLALRISVVRDRLLRSKCPEQSE